MIVIERLRELEKKYETRLENWTRLHAQDQQNDADGRWNRAHMLQCQDILDDLRTLIADLGQEVGAVEPVAWEYRVRGIDAIWVRGEGSINADYNDEYWEARYLYDRPTSPAHTSEARDAARYRWLAENAIIQWPGVTHIGDDPASTRLPLDNAIDAAMRQEGGNAD